MTDQRSPFWLGRYSIFIDGLERVFHMVCNVCDDPLDLKRVDHIDINTLVTIADAHSNTDAHRVRFAVASSASAGVNVVTPLCPRCNSIPSIIVSGIQAFCGNEECDLYTWKTNEVSNA